MKTNRLFCLIELAAVAALYFFENNSGTRAALAVSALVPLLSVLCAYRCSRKAALSLDVPRHGEKGAPLVCRLCAPPLLLCEGRAELRLQNAFTREEARAAAVVGEAVSLSVSHCGLLTVTAENAEIRDLFGLCRFPVSSGAPQTVPVWPTVFPAQVTLDCAAPQTREDSRLSAVRRGGDFTETQAIRPYHPGDPVRQIHWKLSAKMGKTMLREAGAPLTGDVLLALAVFPDEAPDPDALEAYSAACSPRPNPFWRRALRTTSPFGGARRWPYPRPRIGRGRSACSFRRRRRPTTCPPPLRGSPSFPRARPSTHPIPSPV